MSASVNKAIIVGNLGAYPESRRTQDGRLVVNLRVATSEAWRDKATGERKEKTEWHRVTIWNEGLAKVAESYLKKGSKVYIEGQIETRKWTDQAGTEKYSTEIVLHQFNSTLTMLDGPPQRDSAPAEQSSGNSYAEATGRAQPSQRRPVGAGRSDMDDDIPFAPEWR